MNQRIIWVIIERYIPVKILLFVYLGWSATVMFLNDPLNPFTGYFHDFLKATFLFSFANFIFLVVVPGFFYAIGSAVLQKIFQVKRTALSQEATRMTLALLLLVYSVTFAIGHIYYWHTKNQIAAADSELTVLTIVAVLNYAEIFYFGLNRKGAQWVYRHIVFSAIIGMVVTFFALFFGVFLEKPSPISLGLVGVLLFSARFLYMIYDQKNQVTSVLTGDTEPN